MRTLSLAITGILLFSLSGCGAGDKAQVVDDPTESQGGSAGKGGGTGAAGNAGGGGSLIGGMAGSGGASGFAGHEICGNGLDDEGNGQADDGCDCELGALQFCYAGAPWLAGVGRCQLGRQICRRTSTGEFPANHWTECEDSVLPVAELCGDAIDNNCDGSVDEGCSCQSGTVVPCKTECGPGQQVCMDGKLSDCSAAHPTTEFPDGVDNDCDGSVDEGSPCEAGAVFACHSACGTGLQTCVDGKVSECDVAKPSPEIPDGKDNDCNGQIDEGSSCGDKRCNDGAPDNETCANCEKDCGPCSEVQCPDEYYAFFGACCPLGTGSICAGIPACLYTCPPVCGDGTCDPSEACACPIDCGECCGDGTCTASETCDSCPKDCGTCAVCGNGTCEQAQGEFCSTCAQDCGVCPACGDGACNGAETCNNCPQDCGECCGNGICDTFVGEACDNCPQDCGTCAVCGDGKCEPDKGEICTSCPKDCGECCGNGACDNGETHLACPEDCGPGGGGPMDGDGKCESSMGETCETSPKDCGECCGNGACSSLETCTSCPQDCGACACGDGKCEPDKGETCTSCPADCGACCGNGVCDAGLSETCTSCPQDCGACPCGDGICDLDKGETCSSCQGDCGVCCPVDTAHCGGALGPCCETNKCLDCPGHPLSICTPNGVCP